MGPYNEFAILELTNYNLDYSTIDSKNIDVITVSDQYINKFANRLLNMETFWHTLTNQQKGLARYGVTLIPPKSLLQFKEIVLTSIKEEKKM